MAGSAGGIGASMSGAGVGLCPGVIGTGRKVFVNNASTQASSLPTTPTLQPKHFSKDPIFSCGMKLSYISTLDDCVLYII